MSLQEQKVDKLHRWGPPGGGSLYFHSCFVRAGGAFAGVRENQQAAPEAGSCLGYVSWSLARGQIRELLRHIDGLPLDVQQAGGENAD